MDRRILFASALLTLTVAGSSLAVAAEADARKGAAPTAQIADLPGSDFTLAPEAAMSTADNAMSRIDLGFSPEERTADAPACSNGSAQFSWTITDGCSDGRGLYVRFFDVTNDLVWPNWSQAYIIGANKTGTVKLTVKRGARICYGAETNPQDGGYWGLSLDGNETCSTCCTVVPATGNVNRSVKLTC